MNKNLSINLIDGNFDAHEAKEILMNIYSTKIQFHELKDFSSRERFGKPDEMALKRIPELKSAIAKFLKLIEEAKKDNKKLVISSQIHLSLEDE